MNIRKPIARLSAKETTLGVQSRSSKASVGKSKVKININPIKVHVSYKSARLYSVGSRHYFEYNGKSFGLTKPILDYVLKEIEYLQLDPIESSWFLITESKKGSFKNLSK